MDDHDERVRQRAYKIWIEEGRPEGRAEIHWEMAGELVAIEENLLNAPKPAPAGGAEFAGRRANRRKFRGRQYGGDPDRDRSRRTGIPPSRSNFR